MGGRRWRWRARGGWPWHVPLSASLLHILVLGTFMGREGERRNFQCGGAADAVAFISVLFCPSSVLPPRSPRLARSNVSVRHSLRSLPDTDRDRRVRRVHSEPIAKMKWEGIYRQKCKELPHICQPHSSSKIPIQSLLTVILSSSTLRMS